MQDSGVMVPIAFFVCAAVAAIGVPIARAFARWMDREGIQPGASHDVTSRLERMEQSIDSIAIEVERISEGQRFTTKLLSDRAAAAANETPGQLP